MATKPWRQYQTDVAALLGELGFATKVEDRLTSNRGVTHAVDVSARCMLAGVEVLWVVECKLWRTAVPKEKVAALAAIGEDLGADHCLLMSETGFQSGAIQMATGRAFTLTSLEDLRANATADLLEMRRQCVDDRLRSLEEDLKSWYLVDHAFERLRLEMLFHSLTQEERDQLMAEPTADLARNREQLMDKLVQLPRFRADPRPLARPSTLASGVIFYGDEADERAGREFWADRFHTEEACDVAATVRDCRTAMVEASWGKWPVSLGPPDNSLGYTWGLSQFLNLLEGQLRLLERRAAAVKLGRELFTDNPQYLKVLDQALDEGMRVRDMTNDITPMNDTF